MPGTDETERRLREVAPKAEKAGVILGVESSLSAEDNMRIIDRVGSPAVKVYYDVANSTERGYDIGKEIRWLGKHGQICESGLHTLPFGRRYRDHFVQHISGDALDARVGFLEVSARRTHEARRR
jgi:sugar phosphate isomerase/epimerase